MSRTPDTLTEQTKDHLAAQARIDEVAIRNAMSQ